MREKIIPLLSGFLLVFMAAGRVGALDKITVTGSDLMGPAFRQALQSFAEESDVEVALDLKGTRLGQEAIGYGQADVGIFTSRSGELKIPTGWVEVPFAFHTMVAVVSRDLPVNQINFRQLGSIYGMGEAATQLRWGEFGALGEWRGRAILPKIVGPRSSIIYDLMRYTVLRTPAFKSTVEVLPTSAEVLARVLSNEGAIGLLPSLPPGNPDLKVLLVGVDRDDVAFGPTPENLMTGDYPIRLRVSLVIERTKAAELNRLLRFLLSEDVADALRADGMVPLPISQRNQAVFDLEVL